jgi:hypothetical protein
MSNFKPQATYSTNESVRDYWNSPSYARKSMYIVKRFKTYRELIKNMPAILEDSIDEYVSVYRSKRGEWGEWGEHWQLDSNGKPVIIKQGWS